MALHPDAPAAAERCAYQFRPGPDIDGIRWLLAHMPPDQMRRRAGLDARRAGY